jgi:hypothetical protein
MLSPPAKAAKILIQERVQRARHDVMALVCLMEISRKSKTWHDVMCNTHLTLALPSVCGTSNLVHKNGTKMAYETN